MNLNSNDEDSEGSDIISSTGDDADIFFKHYRVPKLVNNGPYGLNNSFRTRGHSAQVKLTSDGRLVSLTELAAQKVACHLPFGLVEHYDPPVPEPLQCRIAYWSFPQDEEDIKLYTCLANGSADFFYRAEDLINQNAVRDMLQVGFHLSANVQLIGDNEDLDTYRVALTFDRRRLTTCKCSCTNIASWCQHTVAVCLQRIRRPQEVKLRAPVSESLQRLEKNQLQKFALYLINELPQQTLPEAQKLLDELLSGNEADINQNPAAPDPTAGATINEQTNWCLDYKHLSSDIQRILIKQCTVQPTVCSDIQSLHVTAPPATTEYSQLLRPIRGREPEGIWNLIAIVAELMKRRDPNVFNLLEIMTEEVMKLDKIVTWWFETKVSLHSGSSIHFTQSKNSQCTSQYSCSNFCDEIVHLWRLVALNPSASPSERQTLEKKFTKWHLAILEKHNTITGSTLAKTNNRNLLDMFPGFKTALEACHIEWSEWDEKRTTLISVSDLEKVKSDKPSKATKKRRRKIKAAKLNALNNAKKDQEDEPSVSSGDPASLSAEAGSSIDDAVSAEGFAENSNQEHPPLLEANVSREQSEDRHQPNGNEYEDPLQVYFMDERAESPRPDNSDDLAKHLINPKRLTDPLEVLYSKVEGLCANGYIDEARLLARTLAIDILSQENYPTYKQLYVPAKRRKKKGNLDNQMSIVASETLTKVSFLCNVLIEDPTNYSLIFKLVIFGVELKRAPAATKPLEVKLISQKQELIILLKNITLQDEELNLLREKASSIRDSAQTDEQPDALTLLTLGSYIFETLTLSRQSRMSTDAELGFQSALVALASRVNVSEIDHPLLCEGIRRQRGELALSLITHYKDDQEKLDAILKHLLDKDLIEVPEVDKSPSGGRKNAPRQESNHPTEAAAYFMYELAKTVYDEAGCNSTTVHLFRPQVVAQNGGRAVHRKLQLCSLRIALYALGLQNRTSQNWMERTYNGRVTFIHDQAFEIGLPAIKFLCDNWQGYLSPIEAASIASSNGCTSEPETRRIAAEMAKSCLKYVNYLHHSTVDRILSQCRAQSIEMAKEACLEIEQLAQDDNICADILFTTSRSWYAIYSQSGTNEQCCADENLYQLNNLVVREHQDNGVSDWLATSEQSHANDNQTPLINSVSLPVWEEYAKLDFVLTAETPTHKNKEFVKAAFRVGLKALDSLKLSTHVGSKHDPKKIDDILWLLGISKSMGLDGIYKFSRSVLGNITDPYILHVIFIEMMKFFSLIKVPENHNYRRDVLMPIYENCLNRCVERTFDLMAQHKYDRKSCFETILDILQDLTKFTQNILTAQYYWSILTCIDPNRNEKGRIDKRKSIRRYGSAIPDRLNWLKSFAEKQLMVCGCEQCWEERLEDRNRFKWFFQFQESNATQNQYHALTDYRANGHSRIDRHKSRPFVLRL